MILTVFSIAIFSLFFIYVLICVRTLRYYLLKKLLKLACRFCWLYQPFSKTQVQNPSFYHCRAFNHINYAKQDHKLVFKIYSCIAHPLNKDHCHLHKVKYIHPWNNQKIYWLTHRSTNECTYMKFENKQSLLHEPFRRSSEKQYPSYCPVLWDSWKSVFILNLQSIFGIIKKSKFVKEKTPGMIDWDLYQ